MELGDNHEQELEHEKQAHYEAMIPDHERRDAFATANIAENVKELLWKVKQTPIDAEGNISEEHKSELKLEVYEIIKATDSNENDEVDEQDVAVSAKAREAFSQSLKDLSLTDGKIREVLAPEDDFSADEAEEGEPTSKPEDLVDKLDLSEEDKEVVKQRLAVDKLIKGKEQLTPEEMQAVKAAMTGLKKEHRESLLQDSKLNDEQKAELLDGVPSIEEEDPETPVAPEDEEEDPAQKDALERAKKARVDIETSDMSETDKKEWRARLRTLMHRLEEKNVNKIARGLFKVIVLAAIALMIAFIFELQLFGKASKKK